MPSKSVDSKSLDYIFDQMIQTMDQSKRDIFIISEQSRSTYEQMKKELEEIRSKISVVISEGDALEQRTKFARSRLAEVSRNFAIYSEVEVRKAYETANDLQIKLLINKTEEKQLRDRRDDLERRLQGLYETIERADQLVTQVNVVLNYLSSDLQGVGEALENAKLKQDFSFKIIEAQEEERKRLSREIHDGPAQMMANVLLRSDLINRTFQEKGAEKAIIELNDLKVMVRSALTEVRRIIYDLRPMALDDLGLIPTLKKYLSTIEEYNPGTLLHFSAMGEEKRLHINFEVAIFRLVQESITNAIKHGKAKDVWVKIEWMKKFVNVSVRDNGTGFDQAMVKEQSFGMIGMKERIELLKGKMEVDSKIGEGTTIRFQISLNGDGV